jgi:hypothetical protein
MKTIWALWSRRRRARQLLQKETKTVQTTTHALEANAEVRRDLEEIRRVEKLRRAKPQ